MKVLFNLQLCIFNRAPIASTRLVKVDRPSKTSVKKNHGSDYKEVY